MPFSSLVPCRMAGAAGAAVLGCLLALLAACGGSRESPEARIRGLVAAAEEAAEGHDVSALGDLVSDEYSDARGYNRQSVLRIVQGVLLRNRQIHLLSVVRNLRVEDDKARGTVLVAMAGQPIESTEALVDMRADLIRFDVDFLQEGGEWRVQSVAWRRGELSDFL